jgi:hypothetical protein
MAGKYTAHHPAPPNRPGVNWVEKAGGLPKPIDAIMRALMAKGMPQSRSVATAVSSVKTTCATGRAFGGKTKVSPEARAVACKAVAEWEALKARSHANLSEEARRVLDMAAKTPKVKLRPGEKALAVKVNRTGNARDGKRFALVVDAKGNRRHVYADGSSVPMGKAGKKPTFTPSAGKAAQQAQSRAPASPAGKTSPAKSAPAGKAAAKFWEKRTNTSKGNPRKGLKYITTKDKLGRTVHVYRIKGKTVPIVVK